MNKAKFMATLTRCKRVFKIGTIAASIVFGVIFVILFAWEAIAPYTVPMGVVWALIVAVAFPYLFGGAYFVNEFIMKVCTRRENQI